MSLELTEEQRTSYDECMNPTPSAAPEPQVPSSGTAGQSSPSLSGFAALPKKTLLLIGGLAILTIVLLYVAITQGSTQPHKSMVASSPTPVAQTTLSLLLLPNQLTTSTRTVSVQINTGGNSVTAVQLELNFTPNLFSSVSASAGNFFTNPQLLFSSTDLQSGNLTYAIGVSSAQQARQGAGEVMQLHFVPLPSATGEATIRILPKSLVTASGIAQSVLKTENVLILPLNAQPTIQSQASTPAAMHEVPLSPTLSTQSAK